MQVVDLLRRTTLFGTLSDEQLAHIAALCVAREAEPGTVLTQQGDLGSTYLLIESGEAITHRIDEQGKQRPVGMLGPGDAYGVASLFLGEPRDVTVTATTAMRVWILERQDLDALLDERPDIWDDLRLPDDLLQRLTDSQQDWLEPGEIVVARTRRHPWMLLSACLLPTLALLAYSALLLVVSGQGAALAPWTLFVLPAIALYLLSLAWIYVDWTNDYLAVTNRRVVHQERIALLYESRDEVILDRIQNLQVSRNFWGATIGFGDLTLETAARSGFLQFTAAPDPESLRDLIFQEQGRFVAARRAAERRLIKHSLAVKLAPDSPPSEEDALVQEPPLGQEPSPTEHPPASAWRRWVSRLLGPGIAAGTLAAEDAAVWRKHWLAAVGAAFLPGLVLLALTLLAVTPLRHRLVPGRLSGDLRVATIVLFVAALAWLVWALLDWANDVYVVTADRIIHVERRPLLFSEARREASLSMIQHVSLRIPHMVANLLNYGDVVVETAGPGQFAFRRVGRPREVQREIFRRIEAHREAQREREASRQRNELTEWFDVFQELHSPTSDDPPEPAASPTPESGFDIPSA